MSKREASNRDEIWVLFVDDDPKQLMMLKPLLESCDPKFHVDTLSDPIRAVEMLRNFEYDCVVSEFIAGGEHDMNIFKAVKNIKPIPTILYTTRDYNDVKRMAQLSDINGYILKINDPEDYPLLIRFVREIVKKYRVMTPDRGYKNDPWKTWQTKKQHSYGIPRDVVHGF
ncbi:response regulator [Candidatus Bathyarchaeota archaeon]|nr:response regulator [Candidatus Bathyarchaeota archaeon]